MDTWRTGGRGWGKRQDGQNRISVSRQVKQKRLEHKYHTELPWNHFLCGAFKLNHGFNRWSSWLWGDVTLCSWELMQIKGQTCHFKLCYLTPFLLFVKNTWAGIFTANISHNVPKQQHLQPINSTQHCLDVIICSEGHTESLISSGTTKASYTSSSSLSWRSSADFCPFKRGKKSNSNVVINSKKLIIISTNM